MEVMNLYMQDKYIERKFTQKLISNYSSWTRNIQDAGSGCHGTG